MWAQLLTIQEVNGLISEHFIKIFGNIVEHCPAAAIGILKNRPFEGVDDLVKAISNYLDGLKLTEQINVLEYYPDVISKLTDFSNLLHLTNQKVIGYEDLSLGQKIKLSRLNEVYKAKFGFPFVICLKDVSTDSIFTELESRLQNNLEEEVSVAIEEIKKMVKLKISEIVR